MSVKKDIKETVDRIETLLTGNLKERAKRADELEEYLSHVELRVKSVSEVPGSDGTTDIRVVYECPQIIIRYDGNGNIIENETFKAINMLNLIPLEDMQRIISVIENKKSLK